MVEEVAKVVNISFEKSGPKIKEVIANDFHNFEYIALSWAEVVKITKKLTSTLPVHCRRK